MPFRPERYPANWSEIRAAILARAAERCECSGQCGGTHDGARCNAPNRALIERNQNTLWRYHTHNGACVGERCGGVRVILTIAHVDHDERNNDERNLLALCQRCHFRLDARDNARRRRERILSESGQLNMKLEDGKFLLLGTFSTASGGRREN